MRAVADAQRVHRFMRALADAARTDARVYFQAQALAKIERGHAQDLMDVQAMHEHGLVEPAAIRDYFARLEPDLYRFPAIDPPTFRRAVEAAFPS